MTKPYFTVTGIPEQLEPRPDGNRRTLTLGEIETIMWRDRQFVIPVVGDCMEQAGIVNSGWVAVDTTRFPAPPRYKSKGGDGTEDTCLCLATFPGQHRPMVMLKSYIGMWGPMHTVSTRYRISEKHPYNLGMEALGIFGIVYASWDADGHLLWQREPSSFPDKLGAMPTIHGEPMPVNYTERGRRHERVQRESPRHQRAQQGGSCSAESGAGGRDEAGRGPCAGGSAGRPE